MNYRHAFHAGNFADVMKHAVLARVLAYLAEKPAAYRVIDTHAGAGLYDLSGAEAMRTGEWRDGIGRLREAALDGETLDGETRALLEPYLGAVAACNGGGYREENEWPLERAQVKSLYLNANKSGAVESLNDGSLSWDKPSGAASTSYASPDAQWSIPGIGTNVFGKGGFMHTTRRLVTFTSANIGQYASLMQMSGTTSMATISRTSAGSPSPVGPTRVRT